MGDSEAGGAGGGVPPSGPPERGRRGAPGRPLLEAGLLLAALFLPAYLPLAAPGADPGLASAAHHLGLLAADAPKALLVLYLMAAGEGLGAFGIRRPAAADLAEAAVAAGGALLLVLGAALALSACGLRNPVMVAAESGPRAGAALLPLVLASSLSVGYCEELFFRSYLIRRLGQAGLAGPWPAIASSLVFGAAHGYQGAVGIVSGTLLGLWFAWRWKARGSLHGIAAGHALFDAIVTIAAIYPRPFLAAIL